MERSILLLLLVLLCFHSYGQAPDFGWAKSIGGDGVLDDEGLATTVDTYGNSYTTGFFSGTGDFDPGSGTTTLTEAGGRDIFITKFDAAGNLVWAKAIGSTGQDVGNDITVNYAGDILVTGYFQGTVDFDPGNSAFLTSDGGSDAFILKLDQDGNYLWAKRVGANAPATGGAEGKSLAWDNDGNVYLAGVFTGGPIDFDPASSATHPVSSAGDYDGFILKLDELGAFVWGHTFGSTGADQALGVAVDYNRHVIVTGSYTGTVDFDPGASNYDLTAVGSYSAFTVKLDDTGALLWVVPFNSSGAVGHAVSTNSYAEVIIMGVFSNVTNFDPGGTFELTPPNFNQTFLAKLSEQGEFIFALQTEGSGTTRAFDLYVDVYDNDNIYLAGASGGTVDYDPGPGTTTITWYDGYILALEREGTFRWVLQTAAFNRSIAVASGAYITAGEYSSSVDFNLDTPVETLTSVGGSDVFIQVFQSPMGTITIDEEPDEDLYACVDVDCVSECDEPAYTLSVVASGPFLNYMWQRNISGVWTDLDAYTWGPGEYYEDYTSPDLEATFFPNSTGVELRCRIYSTLASTVYTTPTTVHIRDAYDDRAEITSVSGCGPGSYLAIATGTTDGLYVWYDDVDGDPIPGAVNGYYYTPEISSPVRYFVRMSDGFCQGPPVSVMVTPEACSTRPNMRWAGTLRDGTVDLYELEKDPAGNIYALGDFRDSPDFDPSVDVFTMTGTSISDNFLMKMDNNGELIWALQMHQEIGAEDIAVDNSGNVFVTGYFQNTIDIDPGPGIVTLTSSGGTNDIFILKLNTAGVYQWAHRIGGGFNDRGRAVATDASGNVYITGNFDGNVDFNPDIAVSFPMSALGNSDSFILKLDPAGIFTFVRGLRSSSNMSAYDIAVDAGNNIYSIGRYAGSTNDFDPGASSFNMPAPGVAVEIYVSKLLADGSFGWAGRIGGTAAEEPNALTLDAAGNLYITGEFNGTPDFDPGPGTFEMSGRSFALKLTATGNFVWAKSLGGNNGNDIALDPAGNVIIIGDFDGNMDADPGTSDYFLRSTANTDVFVTQLNTAGDFVWAYNLNNSGYAANSTTGTGLVVDANGNIFTGGTFDATVDLDPGDCTYAADNGGFTNVFFQKLHPDEKDLCINIQPQPVTLCEGMPLTLRTNATGTTNITYQWGKINTATSVWEPLTEAAPYSGTTSGILTIETTANIGTEIYSARVSGDGVPDDFSIDATTTIGAALTAPGVTGTTGCAPGEYTLVASGASDGNYRWYEPDGTTVIDGEQNHFYITPEIAATTSYFVAIADATCESPLTEVIADISSTVTPPGVSDGISCTAGGDIVLSASGGSAGQYQWYPDLVDPTPLVGSGNATFTATSVVTTTAFYVAINDGTCESDRVLVSAIVNEQTPPSTTDGSVCGTGTVLLSAAGSTDGNYRWYTDNVTSTPISGQVNSTFTTPSLTASTTYYVSVTDGTCESTRSPAIATINSFPPPPEIVNARSCTPAAVTLNASGAVNGQYRWYTLPTGGTAISGEVNSSYTTPVLSVTTPYYVSVDNGCEGTRATITATIVNLTAPIINSSVVPVGGNVMLCDVRVVEFTAPAGFASYAWSTGESTSSIIVSTSATISVTVTDASGCVSPASSVISVFHVGPCVPNQPPVIEFTTRATGVNSSVTINVLDLITDDNDNLDLSTLQILEQPISGAAASFNANQELIVDYTGVAFSGLDRILIGICDVEGLCTQQQIFIDVVGEVAVYNAVSPNGDGLNDIFLIEHIQSLNTTMNNHVWIYNRWGSLVFDIENYDNVGRVFSGLNNDGNELTSGTYFYKIQFRQSGTVKTGYLTLKR